MKASLKRKTAEGFRALANDRLSTIKTLYEKMGKPLQFEVALNFARAQAEESATLDGEFREIEIILAASQRMELEFFRENMKLEE